MYCTAHYRLYSTARRPALMSAMPGFLEAAHEHYIKVTGLADLPGDAPLPVYMLAQRQQWAHFTEQLVRENLNIYLSIDAGGYCYHGTCVFWDVGGLGTMSLAAHECLHQFFARHNARLPIWLEEGLCVSAEGFDLQNGGVVFDPKRNLLRMSCLRNALVAGRWIDIEQLVSMDGGDAVQNPRPGAALEYYAQLWALAIYLQSRPDTRADVRQIINDGVAGKIAIAQFSPDQLGQVRSDPTGRAAGKLQAKEIFLRYVSSDLAEFDKGYRQFARELAGL